MTHRDQVYGLAPQATRRKALLKYSADIVAIPVLLLAVAMSLVPFMFSLPIIALVLFLFILYYLRTFIPFIQHNHSHLKTFNYRFPNWLYDLLLTQMTGYSTALWELHHCRGHHRHFLSPEFDVAGITHKRTGHIMSRWMYALRGNLVIYFDVIRIGLKEKREGKKSLLSKLALEFVQQTVITGLLFIWNPWMATACFILPNLVACWFVWWISYTHHLDVPSETVYDGSVTLLSRAYNLKTFNIGHHTAHHEKPTLHWSLLPERTAIIRSRIPDGCLRG